MTVWKFMPQVIAWVGIVLVLGRCLSKYRLLVAITGISGCSVGVVGAWALLHVVPGDQFFGLFKNVMGASFLFMWGIAVAAVYRSTGRESNLTWGERLANSKMFATAIALIAGMLTGVLFASRLAGTENSAIPLILLALAAGMIAGAALALEKILPDAFAVSPAALAAAVSGLLLFNASSFLRLDLFSPLTMKVMKFTHDFVHQFFESMLIPDHTFFRTEIWNYIGFLFGNSIGFWGALIIWLTPAILVVAAVGFEHLPTVAHIRQGAQRRRLLAYAIKMRRRRLVIPVITVFVFAGAVYESRFPRVEYWDPKPVAVSASPAGDIFIPRKGEVDLEDGKLHKYLFKQGGKEARFFVLMTPAGKLTVDLDACSICKPDGYGQAEGTVICYYCKTLIPLDTVGKPGGCNPVPVTFNEKEDGVHIDGITLINSWNDTVQATSRVKESGK
jgi:hypothetical protein